jgi:hypothetical protein
VHARRSRAADRRLRPLVENRVLADEGAVEVDRERGERAGKVVREVYGTVPPVDFTTYAETSAICWSDIWPLNAGICAPPFVTWAVTAR